MRFLRRRGRGDRGAVLVEAAFALPIVIFSILGTADVGNAIFQTSQASGAARDAARAAIIHHKGADVSTSTNRTTFINPAVTKRLVGQSYTLVITCAHAGVTITCDSAVPGDKLTSLVTWTYNPLSPFGRSFGVKTIKGSSTMTILNDAPASGAPVTTTTTTTSTTTTTTTSTTLPATTTTVPATTTTVAPTCIVTSVVFNPAPPYARKSNGQFQTDIDVTVNTNNAAACTGLTLRSNVTPAVTDTLTRQGTTGVWTGAIDKQDGSKFAVGSNSIDVLNGSSAVLFTITIQVTS